MLNKGQLFMPSTYPRSMWIGFELMALLGLFVFAACDIINSDIGRKGEFLLLLATILSFAHIWKNDPDRWLYLILIFFLIYISSINVWAKFHNPIELDHANKARDHLRMFWFFIAGWWIGGSQRSAITLLTVACMGLVVSILWHGGLSSWEALFDGQRVDFGIHNAQHTAIYIETMILGLFTVGLRLLRIDSIKKYLIPATLWFFLVLFSIAVFWGTQTRQAWLSLILVLMLILPAYTLYYKPKVFGKKNILIILSLLGMFLVIGSINRPFSGIKNRIVKESKAVVEYYYNKPNESIPITSATIRLMLWDFAIDKISEKPLFGYGSATNKQLLIKSDLPNYIRNNFGHFHNSYLELWIAYGVIAPLMFLGILIYLTIRLIRSWKNGYTSNDIAILSISWIIIFFINNCFESYVNYRSGAYMMLIMGGIIYSLGIPVRRKNV